MTYLMPARLGSMVWMTDGTILLETETLIDGKMYQPGLYKVSQRQTDGEKGSNPDA